MEDDTVNHMTSAIINLTEDANYVLNMVKARFEFRNKSDAVNFVLGEYAKSSLEPQLRPEYARKLKKIRKEKGKVYASLSEMRKEYE